MCSSRSNEVSPFRERMVTGTISCFFRPSSQASWASFWERSAYASTSSREMP
jgi:hypothetical protein